MEFLKFKFLIISYGAIIGTILRLLIKNIFLANIIGCFLLGFINKLNISNNKKLFVGFGICGSLTTFSSWILDLFLYLHNGLILKFLISVISFLSIGYLAICLGNFIARKLTFRINS